MILEVATIEIAAANRAGFEEAMRQAAPVIASATGYLSHEVRRCVETPHRYILFVHWETLENHMNDFRQSPAFQQWRALIGPFFTQPPVVVHYEVPFVSNAR